MKQMVILEVGSLEGVFMMIVGIIILVSLVLSFAAAGIFKLIYESKEGRKLSKGQFWMAVVVGLLICGLISGMICG
jgi:hypothetical protein